MIVLMKSFVAMETAGRIQWENVCVMVTNAQVCKFYTIPPLPYSVILRSRSQSLVEFFFRIFTDYLNVQSNFNGLNIFGTMENCSRQR